MRRLRKDKKEGSSPFFPTPYLLNPISTTRPPVHPSTQPLQQSNYPTIPPTSSMFPFPRILFKRTYRITHRPHLKLELTNTISIASPQRRASKRAVTKKTATQQQRQQSGAEKQRKKSIKFSYDYYLLPESVRCAGLLGRT
jgi:hypothetical protein